MVGMYNAEPNDRFVVMYLSPPMATPSYTPLVFLMMMLFSSLDIPPDRDTYATL